MLISPHDDIHREYRKGERIAGEYRVLSVFGGKGRSGQGVVYLVDSPDAPLPFVLKTFQFNGPGTKTQFIKEAESWVSLGFHPNLVSAHWVRELDGQLFIAAEFIPGDKEGRATLTDFIADGPQPLSTVCFWAAQFCDGMEYALRKGLVAHHDIKPDNLMVDPGGTLRITDFGLASLSGDTSESTGGTLSYMAPEKFIAAQQADHRADIYAFGIVLYQLATGGEYPYRLPARFSDPATEFARIHLREPIKSIPSPVYPIIERCLDKNPIRRLGCKELRVQIVAVARAAAIAIPNPPPVEHTSDDELYARAQSFVALGKPEAALQAIELFLKRRPDAACGWTEKGRILLETGEDHDMTGRPCWISVQLADAAIAATRESLTLNPFDSHAWNNLGLCYLRLRRFNDAIETFRKAISYDPYNTGAMMHLAFALAELGNTKKPTELLLRALKLRPQKETLRFNAGNVVSLIVKNGGLEEGRLLLEQLVSLEPEKETNWFNLALVYQSGGRLDNAIQCYRKAVALKPDDGFALMSLARLFADQGEIDEAIRCCDACIDSETERVKPIALKAQLLDGTGRYQAAVELLSKALRGMPHEDTLWFILATIHERHSEWSASLAAANHVRSLLEQRGDCACDNFRMVTDLINRLSQQVREMAPDRSKQPVGAAVKFQSDGRAILQRHEYERDGATDLLLQLARVFRRDLKGNDLRTAALWAEKITRKPMKNGVWEGEHEDAFVRGYGRFCWEGNLDSVAAKTSLQFRNAYPVLAESPFDVELDEQMCGLFKRMFVR
jgi:tetratricopeptide (TPR) repeat protein